MTTREEIIVKAGFDNTSIAKGLRTTQDMLKGFASTISGFFGGAMILGGLNKVLDKVDAIRNSAAQTGFSSEGIQKFQFVVKELGLNAGTASYALMYLSKNIGEATNGAGRMADRMRRTFLHWGIDYQGRSTEQVFYEIMDAMQRMTDPAQRTAMAMDLMSTDGIQLLPILQKGREAFEAMANHAPLISDADLEKLEQAKKIISESEDQLTVWAAGWIATAARGIEWISRNTHGPLQKTATGLKYINPDWLKKEFPAHPAQPESMPPDVDTVLREADRRKTQMGLLTQTPSGLEGLAKLDAIRQQAAGLVALSQNDAGNLNYYLQDQLELAKKIVELAEAKKAAETETLQINRQVTDLQRQQSKLQGAAKFLRIQDLTGGKMPSIEDLAAGGGWLTRIRREYGLGGVYDLTRGPFKNKARQLEQLQYQYAWNVLHPGANSDAFMAKQADMIDSLKATFIKAGIMSPEDAYKAMIDNTEKIKENIAALLLKASKEGLNVNIPSN